MNIDTEDAAREAVALWRLEPPWVQGRNLKLAVESLELNQMYYEQKGSLAGVARVTACLAVLNNRLKELEAE